MVTLKQSYCKTVYDHSAFNSPQIELSIGSDLKTSSLPLQCHWKLKCQVCQLWLFCWYRSFTMCIRIIIHGSVTFPVLQCDIEICLSHINPTPSPQGTLWKSNYQRVQKIVITMTKKEEKNEKKQRKKQIRNLPKYLEVCVLYVCVSLHIFCIYTGIPCILHVFYSNSLHLKTANFLFAKLSCPVV